MVSGESVADQVLAAAAGGYYLDCGASGTQTGIDASVVRAICLNESDRITPFGIRLIDARIEGRLDLSAITVAAPLEFIGCRLDEAIYADGARLHELVVSDEVRGMLEQFPRDLTSELGGLVANGVEIRRDLILSGTRITGSHKSTASVDMTSAIWLTEARIGGRLLGIRTSIVTDADRSLQADRTHIAGDVRLINGFTATAEVRMIAIHLEGSLDLSSAQITPHGARAIDLGEAHIGASLFILDRGGFPAPYIKGRIEAGRALIGGTLHMRNAILSMPDPGTGGLSHYNVEDSAPGGVLIAPRLTVEGRVVLEHRTVIAGGLLLAGASLNGGMQLSEHTKISNPDSYSVDLANATVASIHATGTHFQGTLNLPDAQVTGALDLANTVLWKAPDADDPGNRFLIYGARLQIGGDLRLPAARAFRGCLYFRSADVGGTVEAAGAVLNNPRGRTLSLHQAHVGGNVRLCDGFTSNGMLVLNRSTIEGPLTMRRRYVRMASSL